MGVSTAWFVEGVGRERCTSSLSLSRYQIPSMKIWYLEGRNELLAKVSALCFSWERSLRM